MAKKPDTYKYLPSTIADHLGDLQISVSKRMDSPKQNKYQLRSRIKSPERFNFQRLTSTEYRW